MTTIQEIRKQISETRSEMKAKGIRRISCFNGGLSGEVYSLNARMFRLELQLKDAKKHESSELEKIGIRWPDGLQNY